MDQNNEELSAEELRIQGNNFVKSENYDEALKFYTKAIDINPKDSTLYSNRSFVHLRLKNYYFANKDADMAIELNHSWPKGHFRKGEVLSEVGHYDSALLSYGRALALKPDDSTLLNAAKKAVQFSGQQNQYEQRLPWVGAGIGIILGVIISLSDHLLTKKPTIKHPGLMVLLVIIISILGYVIARSIRYYQRLRLKSLLEPPPNYENENEIVDPVENDDIEADSQHSRTRYTKAQARLRFRKGKS